MTHDEMIAVLQAMKEDKKVEWKYRGATTWYPSNSQTPDFRGLEYRVKPGPQVRYAVLDSMNHGWTVGGKTLFKSLKDVEASLVMANQTGSYGPYRLVKFVEEL